MDKKNQMFTETFPVQDTLEELSVFTPMETAFRNYYRMQQQLDRPSPQEQEHILNEYHKYLFHTSEHLVEEPDLTETDDGKKGPCPFFEDGPIHVMKHARYMPPILHTHEFFEFFYVLQGNCVQICNEKEYPLRTGDFCLWQYNISHAISGNSDDLLALNILIRKEAFESYFFELLSEQNFLSSYFNRILYGEGDSPMLLFRTENDPDVLKMVCYIYQEFRNKELYWQTLLANLVNTVFIYLLRNHQHNLITNSRENSRDTSLEILQYIHQHYEDISLEQLGAHFGYAPSYLSRLIKQKTGMTFTQIVMEERIHRGAWLLTHTQKSIGQIADEVHCADASHFCRLFKKFYGVSPKNYRKSKQT